MSKNSDEPENLKATPTLTVDWEAYALYLEGSDLSDDEKREFIETIWTIVVGFVDLGFTVKSPEAPCGKDASSDPGSPVDMVQSLVGEWASAVDKNKEEQKGAAVRSDRPPKGRRP